MNIDVDKFREKVFHYVNTSLVKNDPMKASEITDYILVALALSVK